MKCAIINADCRAAAPGSGAASAEESLSCLDLKLYVHTITFLLFSFCLRRVLARARVADDAVAWSES